MLGQKSRARKLWSVSIALYVLLPLVVLPVLDGAIELFIRHPIGVEGRSIMIAVWIVFAPILIRSIVDDVL